MITIYEGRPGAGKSYKAVKDIVVALCSGSIVTTNVFLYHDKVIEYCWTRYSIRVDPANLVYIEDGSDLALHIEKISPVGTRSTPNLIVLDEAHCWFNARDWKENADRLKRQFLWMTQHRKFFVDIIFITQDANNIDAQFRRLTQFFRRYRDLARVSVPLLGQIYPMQHSMEIIVDYDGKTIMSRNIVVRQQEIFQLYESEQILVNAGFKKEVKTGNIKLDVKRRNKTLILHCVKFILIGAIIYNMIHIAV